MSEAEQLSLEKDVSAGAQPLGLSGHLLPLNLCLLVLSSQTSFLHWSEDITALGTHTSSSLIIGKRNISLLAQA